MHHLVWIVIGPPRELRPRFCNTGSQAGGRRSALQPVVHQVLREVISRLYPHLLPPLRFKRLHEHYMCMHGLRQHL